MWIPALGHHAAWHDAGNFTTHVPDEESGDVFSLSMGISAACINSMLSPREREEQATKLVHIQDMEYLSRITGYCETSGCFQHYHLRSFDEDATE